MTHAPGWKNAVRLSLLVAIPALGACESDPIVVDLSPIFDCSFTCSDWSEAPLVWIEGQARDVQGGTLTGRNALILMSPDSTFPGGHSWATPVDSTDGGFARSMDVEFLCGAPLFGRIQLLDATGDTVLQLSRPTQLFDGGLPTGCPFSSAALLNGVPTDTVVARDLHLDST